MLAERAELVAELRLDDKMSGGLKKATGALGSFTNRVKSSHAVSTAFGIGLANVAQRGAAEVTSALRGTIEAAIDWESAVAGVNKTIDATPEELNAITEGLRDISRTTPIAATDLARIAEAAGALGIAKDDVLEFTRVVALIGTTTDVSTDQAATSLGQLANVIGLTADDFDNFAATLVDLGNKGASTESQILEIARRAGSAASLFGLAKDETLAWASAAANLGMNEELAGTSLQNVLLKSMSAFRNASEDMEQIMGMTGARIRKLFEEDAGGALQTFVGKIAALPKDSRLEAVAEIFGKGSGITRLVLGLADSYDRNLVPALQTAATAWDENKAATDEAAKRYATTASQIAVLQNNVKDAAVTIGTALLPELLTLAKDATGWIQGNQPTIKAFAKDLAGGFREAVGIAKSLPWGVIGESLKIAGTGARAVLGAFQAMPDWVQVAVVSGWGLNKLTGGALGGIVGELGKGLIKGVFGMNAGVVNLRAGTVVGGPGGALPGGAAGSRVGGLANAVAKVAVVGMAVGVAAMLGKELADQSAQIREQGKDVVDTAKTAPMTKADIQAAINNIDEQVRDPLKSAALLITNPLNGGFDTLKETRAILAERLKTAPESIAPVVLGPPTPAYAALMERITVAGGKPTAERVKAIMEKNAATTKANLERLGERYHQSAGTIIAANNKTTDAANKTADETRRAAAAQAIASRANAILQSITNARLATIAAKDFKPQVNVNVGFTVSVRDQVVAQQVRSRYTTIGRDEGPRGSGR